MSQNDLILNHLKRAPITPLEAYQKYGCLRLGARIFELRQQGHEIVRELVAVNNRFGEECRVARYKLDDLSIEKAAA